jgi:hypothetical protein
MSEAPPPTRRWPEPRVPLLWACGIALTVAGAFVAVYTVVSPEHENGSAVGDVRRAAALKAFSTELNALLRELEESALNDSPAERMVWETRVEHDLEPRVTEFQRRVLTAPLDGPAYHALLHATDRLRAAAANPGNRRALHAAQTARDTLEVHLRDEFARLP